MEHEVKREQLLLDKNGHISEPGWARREVWKYNRNRIKAPWFRRKEWDYYLFNTEKFAVAFTISDLGYLGLLSVSFIDFENGTEHTESEIEFLPKGKKYGLGAHVFEPNASCHTKRLSMVFKKADGGRSISVKFKDFDRETGKDFKAELFVREPNMEAVYIATPWKEKENCFYYNCKLNCLEAVGMVSYGEDVYKIGAGTCFGTFDWGRGVWTYDNTWFWGTGNGLVNGEKLGFNLGYGFSDRSSASENGFYYKGRVHKLENVTFEIPRDENGKYKYLDPWRVYSADGRFDGVFKPILDRAGEIDFKVVISTQHQVFGRLSGYMIMDDGENVILKDFICALEVVRNRY